MEQVADIGQAHFCHQIHGALGIGQCRRQPAVELLAGVLFDGVDRVLNDLPLLLLIHAHQVAGVVGAVGIKLPIFLGAGFDHLWMVLTHGHIERDAAAHIAALHRVKHAPETGAVAVVAVGVVQHIGRRPGPGRAGRVARRIELIKLHIGRHPKSHPCATRPAYDRTVVVRQVVVKARVTPGRRPAQDAAPLAGTRPSCSSVSSMDSTSAYLSIMS